MNNDLRLSLDAAWLQIEPLLPDPGLKSTAQLFLSKWRGDVEIRRFESWGDLAHALDLETQRLRENYFYNKKGENLNIDAVIYKSAVSTNSIGWNQTKFFEELGNTENMRWFDEQVSSRTLSDMMLTDLIKKNPNALDLLGQALKRRAEQEYLMMNMVKGAIWDAAQVANKFNVGIAVRGTGLLAHMGIETGDPTKAQEFKNKTSKEVDLILCEEMEWSQLGAVVHYDPRVEWSSQRAENESSLGKAPMFLKDATEADWEKKKERIRARLLKLGPRVKPLDMNLLKKNFMARSKEYMEEDHEYRKGSYAPYTKLVGPYVRLKVRANVNMVGDHDLFAFTDPERYGKFMQDTDPRVAKAQKALQNADTFQAQHGGIWYWKPSKTFNSGIKAKIMGAHGPESDEPLVYIRPGLQVTAAYYIANLDSLSPVWFNSDWTQWMDKTHSGLLLRNPVAIQDD